MDHHEAMRGGAVERYLLDEMAARERGEFEEHFFECPECAEDLRITASFLAATRRELKRDSDGGDLVGGPGPPLQARQPQTLRPRTWTGSWRTSLAGGAAALLLCITTYQNAVTYPRLTTRIAQLNKPGILSSVYLVGGNTRSAAQPGVTASTTKPILLSVDIPTGEQYASYACELVASSGVTIWNVPVAPERARDTVPIVVPAGSVPAGHYTLTVRGYTKETGNKPVDLAQYPFTMSSSD